MPGEEKKPNASMIKEIVIAVVAVIVLGSGVAYWYVNYQVPHNEAVGAFEEAARGLAQRNDELDSAIEELQGLMGSDAKPLDSEMLNAASAAIGDAQGAKQDAPEMPGETGEINEAAHEIEGMGDYTQQLEALSAAQSNLQRSIDQRIQVTNPSEQFVIERIAGLPTITGVEAATENNDPNGGLGKAGNYTAQVFFSSDLVDPTNVYADDNYTGIPSLGTDAGGSVEVYASEEDAEKRNEYLTSLDGTILRVGAHTVVGTCIVRVSDLLTASQQKEVGDSIIQSLIELEV